MISDNLKKRIFTGLILLIILTVIFISKITMTYFLIILGVFAVLEFAELIKKIFLKKLTIFLLNFCFVTYIFIFCFIFFYFSNLIVLKTILLLFLICCIASDIGGFIFGKIIKGPKLTKISPKKTYAGAIGSLALSVIVMISLFLYLFQSFSYKVVLIALMTSVFCQIGDLIFSFLKRKAKIKDTGKILPGHGGILDRLDGIFLGLPMGLLSLILFYH